MQSVAPAETATSHALSEAALQQAQRDALETIHKIMLHLAKGLTRAQPSEQEEPEDPAQARITTQRIRLCLQAARDILRFAAACESTPSPRLRETVRSGAERTNAGSPSPRSRGEGARRSDGGRMRGPCDSPDSPSTPPPSPAERAHVRSGAEPTNAGTTRTPLAAHRPALQAEEVVHLPRDLQQAGAVTAADFGGGPVPPAAARLTG